MSNPLHDTMLKFPRVEIHDGESVLSFLRQVALLSGFCSEYWAVCTAMGRHGRPMEAMPAPLRPVCEKFPVLGSVDELLNSTHTLYQYWTFCSDDIARSRIRDSLINAKPGPLRPCRLPVDLESSPYDLVHCPECDRLNATEFGYTPTLTLHLAPFLSLCPRHEMCALKAEQGGLFANACTETGDRRRLMRSLAYGRKADGMLRANGWVGNQKENFKVCMSEHGFVTASGRFRWTEFLDAHCAFHSEPFADIRLTTVCQDKELLRCALAGWLSGRKSLHPVIYCLVTWSLSEVSYAAQNRVPPTGKSRRRLDESAVVDAMTCMPTLTSAAQLLGVTVTTLATRAGELGLPVIRKPIVLSVDRREAIRKAFDSNLSVSTIAAQTGVSVSTIYRVIRVSGQFDQHRKVATHARERHDCDEWAHLDSENPHVPVRTLRRQKPALFARLYRLDRTFSKRSSVLLDVKPRDASTLRRARANIRGPELASAIQNAKLMNDFKRSPRLSEGRIVQLTGISPYSLRTCSSDVRRTLATVAERDTEFVDRRIREACADMKIPDLPCRRWAALRHAGMRLFQRRLQNQED